MVQQHNGSWISGSAIPGPPHMTNWTPLACPLRQRPNGPSIELTRLAIDDLELDNDGVAALTEKAPDSTSLTICCLNPIPSLRRYFPIYRLLGAGLLEVEELGLPPTKSN